MRVFLGLSVTLLLMVMSVIAVAEPIPVPFAPFVDRNTGEIQIFAGEMYATVDGVSFKRVEYKQSKYGSLVVFIDGKPGEKVFIIADVSETNLIPSWRFVTLGMPNVNVETVKGESPVTGTNVRRELRKLQEPDNIIPFMLRQWWAQGFMGLIVIALFLRIRKRMLDDRWHERKRELLLANIKVPEEE